MSTYNEKKQTRVILWCVPRAGSTAFLRCISNREDVKAFREMFVACDFFGPNATNGYNTILKYPIEPDFTFEKIKAKLEADYKSSYIFAKDGADVIYGHFDSIPRGYKHTFLIRKPVKVHMSRHKLFENARKFGQLPVSYTESLQFISSPFYEQLELVKYVRDDLQQEVILMDADDLFQNPEAMMQKWCKAVGIPFVPEMMKWKENGEVRWEMSEGHKKMMKNHPAASKNAIASTCFSSSVAAKEIEDQDIPEDVRKCIQASQPYYEQLYAMRMKI